MSYIRKGVTVSHHLLCLACQILLLARRLCVRILPIFILSEENQLADAASWFLLLPDWHLPAEIFWKIVLLSPRDQIVCVNSIGRSGSFLCLGRFSRGGGTRRAGPGVELPAGLSVSSPSNSLSHHSENSPVSWALSPCGSILASLSLVSGPAGFGHCGHLPASDDASRVGPVNGVTPATSTPPSCLAY